MQDIITYITQIDLLEFGGLIFGLLCVIFLIKENVLTWLFGILYVLLSFVIFWQARLYGDFILHIIFLVLNIYGWYYWVKGRGPNSSGVGITTLNTRTFIQIVGISIIGIIIFAQALIWLPSQISGLDPASLPYWDSTTSVLSITGMWLTARKKLENWYFWLLVDILATGIYYYKELYFYSILYFIYIGLAVTGYLAWRKTYATRAN